MPRRAPDHPPRQRGAALLLALVAAIGVAAAMFAGGLPDRRGEKERHNALVLAAAKEALIGYAVAKGAPPGSFPCPDLANTGSAAGSCSGANMIGRLPWKTIGVADLRDADGECLWYALSPAFKSGVSVLNLNSAGTLTVKDERGLAVASQALAVIFAPGSPVAGNNRTPAGNAICGGNTTAANYLDTSANGVSNASGNRSGNAFTFAVGERSERFNDQLTYIVAADLFAVLRARVAAEIRGDESNGLRRYFAAHGNTLPWAAGVGGGTQQALRTTGYVPYGDADMFYPGSPWLDANGWFGLAGYQVTPPNLARITIGGVSYAYALP